jgi:hypothetical protein
VNKDKLETLKDEVAKRFNDLSEQKNNIVDEMRCLQGEHRLLIKLINEWESVQDGSERNEPTESTNKPKKSSRRKGV